MLILPKLSENLLSLLMLQSSFAPLKTQEYNIVSEVKI